MKESGFCFFFISLTNILLNIAKRQMKSVALLAQIGQAPKSIMQQFRICSTADTNPRDTPNSLRGQLSIVIYNNILRGPFQNLGFRGLMPRIFITLSQVEQAPTLKKHISHSVKLLIQLHQPRKTTNMPHVRISRTFKTNRAKSNKRQ